MNHHESPLITSDFQGSSPPNPYRPRFAPPRQLLPWTTCLESFQPQRGESGSKDTGHLVSKDPTSERDQTFIERPSVSDVFIFSEIWDTHHFVIQKKVQNPGNTALRVGLHTNKPQRTCQGRWRSCSLVQELFAWKKCRYWGDIRPQNVDTWC